MKKVVLRRKSVGVRRVNVAVVVLSVLLLVAVSYIGYSSYSDAKVQEQVAIYQSGAQVGYEQAVAQMFEQVGSCQQVPLRVGNESLNVVAVECLQRTGDGETVDG